MNKAINESQTRIGDSANKFTRTDLMRDVQQRPKAAW